MKNLKFFFLLFSFCLCVFSTPAFATCHDSLEKLPIQAGGRIKPLSIHAKEMIKFLTGKTSYENKSALELYCEMSVSSVYEASQKSFLEIRIDHVDTKKFLGLKEDQSSASVDLIFNKFLELRQYVAQLKARNDTSASSKDLEKLLQRAQVYEDIVTGNNWQIPLPTNQKTENITAADIKWISLKEFADFLKDFHSSKEELVKLSENAGLTYNTKVSDNHLLELRYDKSHLFQWSLLAIIIAMVLLKVCGRLTHPVFLISLILVLGLEISAITFRILISGRAPVTNMYETVMWVGIGSLCIATLLAFFKKEKLYLYLGLFFNLICLFMMTFANNMLDPSIQPLVPVLRDNFWLSTHVTMITISYAALGLSWLVANYHLVKSIFIKTTNADAKKLSELCYDAIKVGVVLLAGGIILGGVWADYSWGRFWGWDPKETWSLIALLFYMAILHGRYSGWITFRNFLPASAFAFMTIIMAWFGVNYILAAGLHSYGFSNGGAIFISSVVILQIAILISYYLKNGVLRKKS